MENIKILKLVIIYCIIAVVLTTVYLIMYMKEIDYSRFITAGLIISGIILGILITRNWKSNNNRIIN